MRCHSYDCFPEEQIDIKRLRSVHHVTKLESGQAGIKPLHYVTSQRCHFDAHYSYQNNFSHRLCTQQACTWMEERFVLYYKGVGLWESPLFSNWCQRAINDLIPW